MIGYFIKTRFTIRLIFFVIIAMVCISCESSNEPSPPTPKPPGYQEDIPWPSLADSPWPMHHGNPQLTGRSKYAGPNSGHIAWETVNYHMQSGIVINNDNTLNFVTRGPLTFYNLDKSGEKRCEIRVPSVESITTPVVSKDSIYYIVSEMGKVYAIKDCKQLWEITLEYGVGVYSMLIDLDENLLVIDFKEKLYSISRQGTILWSKQLNQSKSFRRSLLGLSTDGKTLYISGLADYLIAFDLVTKTEKWQTSGIYNSRGLIIDSDDNIYFFGEEKRTESEYSLYQLNSEGIINWKYVHNNRHLHEIGENATLDKFGNIYFAYDSLYSINYKGQLNWKNNISGYTDISLMCDANNTIYLFVLDNIVNDRVIAVTYDNKILWELHVPIENYFGEAPSFGFENCIYIPNFRESKIFCIK